MDTSQISKVLLAERDVFQKAVRTVIENTTARRGELRSQFADTLGTTGKDISETAFSAALGTLKTISEDLKGILLQAGFNGENVSDWLNGKSTPSAAFRAPLLQMFVTVILDYYVDISPLQELRQILDEHSHDGSDTALRVRPTLDQKLEKLDFLQKLSRRIVSRIKNVGLVTLGELLAMSEKKMLQIPNFGRTSLKELNEALIMNVGVCVGSLTTAERKCYEWRAQTREYLNLAAAKSVLSGWSTGEVKPEYMYLTWDGRDKKVREGAKPYVQAHADTELLEALKQLGIHDKTQLATAPLSVIDQLCHGHEHWRGQLSAMLRDAGLEFGTQVPPFLNDNVAVYHRGEP